MGRLLYSYLLLVYCWFTVRNFFTVLLLSVYCSFTVFSRSINFLGNEQKKLLQQLELSKGAFFIIRINMVGTFTVLPVPYHLCHVCRSDTGSQPEAGRLQMAQSNRRFYR